MIHLGTINGWKEEPIDYINCQELKHSLSVRNLNSRGTYREYCCETCGIKWNVDSGD